MNALAEKWNNYWFREAPLLDLAILRIIAVGAQLALMLFEQRYGMAMLHATAEAERHLFEPLPFLKPILLMLGGHEFTGLEMQTLQLVTIVAGIFALVGLFTKISSVLFAIGVGFIQLWVYSHGDIHHPEAAMVIALAVLALSPCGAVLSLDALRGKRRMRFSEQLVATSREAKWPVLLMQWFFGLMYLSAFYAKLAISNFQWANGYTLQYYLAQDGMRWNSLLGVWMSQFHWINYLGQWIILAFQATFFISLLIPRLKWLYVPAGMAMHIGIYLMFKAPFFQWIALYLVFVPWTALFILLKWLPEGTTAQPHLAKASAG